MSQGLLFFRKQQGNRSMALLALSMPKEDLVGLVCPAPKR